MTISRWRCADEMHRAAPGPRTLRRASALYPPRNDGIMRPQRDQHVADRKTAAPDRIDHGMIGARGGIGHAMAGSAQRCRVRSSVSCTPGREFRKTLIDAELEVKCAVLMPQHDGGCHRRVAGTQRHDLALAGLGERFRRAADKGRHRHRAAAARCRARPSSRWLRGGGTFRWRTRRLRGVRATSKRTAPVFGEAVALAAQFLQLLGTQSVVQQFIGIAGRIEAGANVGLQHSRTHAVFAAILR